MIDSIRIRQLENGYTVKYHLITLDAELTPTAGKSVERYVADKGALQKLVTGLLDLHIEDKL